MTSCSRCLVDARYGVDIDSNGVCSYCRIIDGFSDVISRIGNEEDILRDRLRMFCDKGRYDCIVGLSGGKDSSYIIYTLKAKYDARVLAFTCDNGFLTDYARDNINGIVNDFGVDHIWVRPDEELRRALYANDLRKESWPCSACVHMGESAIWKLAYENKIPFIVSGRTPEQILRRPDRELFESQNSIIRDNFTAYNRDRVHAMASEVLQRIKMEKSWLLPGNNQRFGNSSSLYLEENFMGSDDFAPEYLYFFLYEKHEELKMMETLEQETNWRNPKKIGLLSHLDCSAHDAAGYLFYRMHGVPFVGLETSAMIRHNQLDREQGRKIMHKEIEA
ncbi:MAG: hypothetical protein JW920_12260, partial [Deltaproteobacteria bacterium]|nr:hypothetical protein [Deltaproteobacteria bacterium]